MVDRWFVSRPGQTKDNKIDKCCFSAKRAVLSRKSKDRLAGNQINVSKWLYDKGSNNTLLIHDA